LFGIHVANDIDEWPYCGVGFSVDIKSSLGKCFQQRFQSWNSLCFSNPSLPDYSVVRLCDQALLVSYSIKSIVMKSKKYTVLTTVHICFQVAKTLLDSPLECTQGVFRSGLVISSVGKSQDTIMLQKCVFSHYDVLAS
jgi:hypothetical protein